MSRDITFFETQFPFHQVEKQNGDVETTRMMLELPITEEADMESQNNGGVAYQNEPSEDIIVDNMGGGIHTIEDDEDGTDAVPNPPHMQPQSSNDENENESLGRGCRVKYPSTRLQGYVTNTVRKLSLFPCSPTQSDTS